ncbi:ferritin-like domain-containing protein [Halegenticoccus tardaugens]|uniref:ferritin-like domain-containing protein n=1 Tax=Halegenticoccus tardaugens TaxID=2071624 RepID=UPI00100B8B7F|nr:ferritin-like domain-containing protein [Halegenticoccus tardaugens]
MTDDTPTTETRSDGIDSITKTARSHLTSRRGFLAGAAAIGGGSLVASAGGLSGVAAADDDGNGDGGDDGTDDVDILNYALTLEHLEAAFYEMGLSDFSDDEFVSADLVCGRFGEETRRQLPEYLRIAGEHEAVHVEQLTAVITDLGGEPVAAAEYDFGYETPSEFLEVASALENTGVAAYAGAAPMIEDDEILAAALSIHSVEARHAGTANFFIGELPFPDAFDEPKGMDEVQEIAGGFIVSE